MGVCNISKQRSALMGVAILFIMLFHSGIIIKHPAMLSAFCWGDVGVEMFAVLSAIGVSFSLSRNPSIAQFYKRRLLRIFPTYLAVALPYALFLHFKYGASWGHVVSIATGMSTFRGEVVFWFVSYIMLCYLLAPLFILVKRKIGKPFVLTAIVLVLSYVLFKVLEPIIDNCSFWCLRFPAFALGCDLYDYVKMTVDNRSEVKSDAKRVILSLLIFALSVLSSWLVARFFSNPEFHLLGYLFIVAPLLISLSDLLSLSYMAPRILAFLGGITLELYLVHEHIVLPLVMRLNITEWMIMVLAMVLAILLSVFVSAIVARIRLIFK